MAPPNPPRNHHRVPQWYLRRFADTGRRTLVATHGRPPRLVAVKRASAAPDFYAFYNAQGELDSGFELAFGPVEAAGARIADSMLEGQFPPSPADRLEFAGFLSLQICRGQMFRDSWNEVVAAAGAVPLRNYTMETTIRDLGQLANVLLRMRWRLWRFAKPVLFTGDQPVAYWRTGDSPRFLEGIGPMTAEQVRFVLDPQHILVLTWDGQPADERVYDRGAGVAGPVNRFTARWNEHDLYCRPDLAAILPREPGPPLPPSLDPACADALLERLSALANWQEASIVAESRDWGDPAEGYGVDNPRRPRR